jgi:peptidoglycan/xylan/chitin deacetylase (PgdA/CDA1 family)
VQSDSARSSDSPLKFLVLNFGRTRALCARRNYLKAVGLPTVAPFLIGILIWALRRLGFQFKTLDEALGRPSPRTIVITIDGAYRDVASRIFPTLFRIGVPATVFVVTGHVGKRRVIARSGNHRRKTSGLGWSDLRSLVARGWEIGSLGHAYCDLTDRSQRDQLWQIVHSRDLITENTGVEPVSFSYPFGAYDASTLKFLREAQFVQAVTMRPGVASTSSEALQIERLSLTGFSIRELWRLLTSLLAVWTNDQKNLAQRPKSVLAKPARVQRSAAQSPS